MDTSGPGPKSLEEKAREGGVGGASGGNKGDDEDGPQKESHGEGTGEKYVKSSGMKADGGDFDASNPGAGREADRELHNSIFKNRGLIGDKGLLEEKGIYHEPDAGGPSAGKEEVGGVPDSKPGKTKLSEKIKAKLHIGRDKD